jgi:signal transduction histidine kinase
MVVLGGAMWTMGLFGFLNVNDLTVALNWARFYYVAAAFIAYTFLHFAIYFPFKIYKNSLLFKFITAIPLFIIIYFLYFTNYHLAEIFWVKWGKSVILGKAYIFYTLYFTTYILISFFIWSKKYKLADKNNRLRLKYVFIGTCIPLVFGAFFNLFLPIFNYRYIGVGPLFQILMTIVIFYSIMKFRLMNIRLVLSRSILYAVLVGAIASFFALSVLWVGNLIGGNTMTTKTITYIIDAVVVVIFLDRVKRVWAKLTDRIFYKDKVDYQDVLQKAGNIMTREIDLEKLLQSLTDLLTERLKIKKVFVLVPKNNHFELMASSDVKPSNFSLSANFINYLRATKNLIIIEELIRNIEDTKTKDFDKESVNNFIAEAEALHVEMVIPVVEQERLTAVFLISAKNSGDFYGDDDLKFFNIFIPQIATALEKSKLYEEVQELNRGLQTKVEEKTKNLQETNLTLEERNKFLATMQSITNLITRTMDLKKVDQMIVDSIASELGYVGGILSFLDPVKNVLMVGAITNNANTKKAFALLSQSPLAYATSLREDFNLGARTFLTGQINFSDKMSDFLSPPVKKEEIDKIQEALHIKTAVAVPIFSENKIIGIIHFLLPVARKKLTSMDIEIMTALTNQVGIVSRNLRLYNNLQKANLELQEVNVKLRELDTAKSEFLSIASHQLRTPISAIKGYLSMIIDGDFGKIPTNILKIVKDLFESASRLARLINIFLNVSRIESGRLKLDKRPLQINDLIESVVVELGNQAIQKGLALTYKKPTKKIPLIFADSDKLREVILNLVDNSIKYTLQGKVELGLNFDNQELNFLVKDTGIGLDPQEAKGLFRKFVRGTGVSQIHTGGSGLGLFIAQKIIKEHEGQVWAESKGKGKGSIFQFRLPLYDDKTMAEKMAKTKEEEAKTLANNENKPSTEE